MPGICRGIWPVAAPGGCAKRRSVLYHRQTSTSDEPVDRAAALAELNITGWDGPFAADDQARAIAAPESGRVGVLPQLPFQLSPSGGRVRSAAAARRERNTI